MATAPSLAALSTAVISGSVSGELASTSRILQSGQVAETASRSSAISKPQPKSPAGNGLAAPFWLTFLKQPLAVVQAGSPRTLRNLARSASALGLSIASTIATVRPPECSPDSLYADWMSAGARPTGVDTSSGPEPRGDLIALPRQCTFAVVLAHPKFISPPLNSLGLASAAGAVIRETGTTTPTASTKAARDRISFLPRVGDMAPPQVGDCD